MTRRNLTLILAFVVAVVVAAILVMHFRKSSQALRTQQAAKTREAIPRELYNPASLNEKAPDVYWAKFDTTKGDFVVQVKRSWAPIGADRFFNLVKNGFYNGASFFRVIPGFIVQFGISSNPEISQAWQSADIPDDPVKESNVAGTITFATAGPDTRTTQVFINLADNKNLDSQGFAPFGSVTQGISVVKSFYSGYGEGAPMGNGPDQHLIQTEGESYLAQNFPKLDHIKTAVILQSAPSTDPH